MTTSALPAAPDETGRTRQGDPVRPVRVGADDRRDHGTTAGATDSALDSYTPVGGTAAFVAILLGVISPGGEGGGLYGILVLALLAVFVAGLMVGRTPEFLGKKIRAPQMKLVVAYVLTIPIVVLVFGSMSLVLNVGTSALLNHGMHGLTETTYAYASVATNNGSAFAGLA